MTGGIDIATIVRRCGDHSGIAFVHVLNAAIDIHLARSGPAPGETHRIYSVDLAPLGPERDLWRRCRRWRGGAGLRAVSPAGVQNAAASSSAPDDHFTPTPDCRVIASASGRVGHASGRPAIGAGIVSPACIEEDGIAILPTPHNHFAAGPDRRVTLTRTGWPS